MEADLAKTEQIIQLTT